MGWFNSDHPEHEGYLVGLVHDERFPDQRDRLRELGYPFDEAERLDVKKLQVGCECGWRSARFIAPIGTKYFPHVVDLPEQSDTDMRAVAAELWARHLTDPDVFDAYCARRGAIGTARTR